MQDVRLTAKKRAFPSQGRVRFNIAHLSALGIREDGRVDLINESTNKMVTTAIIADNQVRQGQIRVSEEDLKTLGLQDDEEVLVRKATLLPEKIRKAASDANKSLSKHAGELDRVAKKTSTEIGAGAAKAADDMKKQAKKASDSVGKVAAKTVKDVKKAVKKATGPRDTL
jgi:hypothetical protein